MEWWIPKTIISIVVEITREVIKQLHLLSSLPDWLTSIGTFGLFITGFVGVYRISRFPLQQTLHTRQIDTCLEVVRYIREFSDKLINLRERCIEAKTNDELAALWREFNKLAEDLHLAIAHWSIILPPRTLGGVTPYFHLVQSFYKPKPGNLKAKFSVKTPEQWANFFSTNYVNLINLVRQSLGVDILNNDLEKLLRQSTRDMSSDDGNKQN